MELSAFAPLKGQSQAVDLLQGAIARQRLAPAYLFAGASGVGRSLAARCLIKLLFGSGASASGQQLIDQKLLKRNHPDLLWVEPTYLHQGQRLSAVEATEKGLKRKAPPQIRLEQIREIAQFLSRRPLEASRLVVVVEQAETMAEAAANGLLKTLEEPGQATIILLALDTESILPTLVSRCQRIPFYRLNQENMTQVLRESGHGEILQHPEILAIAQGSPGEAIAAWQQLQTIPAELLQKLTTLPKSLRAALELAKEIDSKLDSESQLWLVDYLQHSSWKSQQQPALLKLLEQARQYLLGYAQPRLVWEVTLAQFAQQDFRKV